MSGQDAADESSQVQRARRKLLKQLESEEQQITPQALQKSGQSVRQWITRHSSDRVNLRDKTFRLFDENRHPEESKSEHVRKVQQRVAASMRAVQFQHPPQEVAEESEAPREEPREDSEPLEREGGI